MLVSLPVRVSFFDRFGGFAFLIVFVTVWLGVSIDFFGWFSSSVVV